jgi:phage baseplate assembly protein W
MSGTTSNVLTNTAISSPYPNAVFVGFSTVNADKNPNTSLYDLALVNQDLYYAFNTRVGERVMRPDWGCRIWDYFMEQLTPALRDQIVAEAIRVCHTDSRVTVQNVDIFQLANGVRVEITLLYQPFNVINSFYVNFENAENNYFSATGVSQ